MEKVKCEYCNSDQFLILFNGYNFNKNKNYKINVVSCLRCGLTYTNPRPDKNEILEYYNQDYYGINNVKFKGLIEKFIHLKRKIRALRIIKIINSGKILDVGCGRGIFLNYMKELGWEVYGTEITDIAAKFAKKILKSNIFIGPLEDHKFPDNFFDVITLFHVLEHLPHPLKTLQEIYRILKPNGLLVISVPNINSWQAQIFKTKWFHLDIPRHFFHFDYKSLSKMLPKEKWHILKIKRFSFEFEPFGWVQSILNIFFNSNLLYNILKAKTTNTLTYYAKIQFKIFRWSTILLNIGWGLILLGPVLLISMLSSLTNYNGIIEIYYQKYKKIN